MQSSQANQSTSVRRYHVVLKRLHRPMLLPIILYTGDGMYGTDIAQLKDFQWCLNEVTAQRRMNAIEATLRPHILYIKKH